MWTSDPSEPNIKPGGPGGRAKPSFPASLRFSWSKIQHPSILGKRFQRGQATLEVLIVLLILIPLIFGGIELSRGVAVRSALDSGLNVMVQAVSIDPNQWGWSSTIVQRTVDQNVFGKVGLDPTVTLQAVDINDQPIGDITALAYGALFCIKGSVGYYPMVPLLKTSAITITVEHCGVIQKID